MKYKVGDIVDMKIIPITTEGPHYTAKMREVFMHNPKVEIIEVYDGIGEYHIYDYKKGLWKILEKWIEDSRDTVSYFIS